MDGVTARNRIHKAAGKGQNVLYISYDGLTNALGQSQIIPYVTALAQCGYRFTILSFEKKAEFKAHQKKIRALLQAHGINWEPLTFTRRPPVVAKLYDWLRMRAAAIRLQGQYRFSVIHCRSYVAGQMGLLLKKKHGCRFLFDMRGFWVDERVDGGIWDLSKFFYRWLYRRYKNTEKELLAGADHIVALTENGRHELVNAYGVAPQRATVIPCCVDTDFFDPATVAASETAALQKSLGIQKGDYVLTYLGKLGTWYLLDEMLSFFRKLQHHQPRARFLLLVDHPVQEAERLVVAKGFLPSDFIIRKIIRTQVPLYLSLSDSSVFFIKPSYSKKGSSPIKAAELMAMGIPIVCNGNVGDMDRIMEDENLGVLVSDFDENSFDKAALRLQQRSFQKDRIREKAIREFSVANGVAQYENIYRHLLAPNPPVVALK